MTSQPINKKSISRPEINMLPLRAYDGPVMVVDSDEKMNEAAQGLEHEKVLGFDTETRPAFKRGESYPPSLVQLAGSRTVYLFPLVHRASYPFLSGILGDKNVVKAGVAVRDDIHKLAEVFPFEPAGFIELADLAARANIQNAGLRGLAGLLFGFRISKGTRCSRWDAPQLTPAQISYAATDAWVCREIYCALADGTHDRICTRQVVCGTKDKDAGL